MMGLAFRITVGCAIAGALGACSLLVNLDTLQSDASAPPQDSSVDAPLQDSGADALPPFLQPPEGTYLFRDNLLDASSGTGGYSSLNVNGGGSTAYQQDAPLMMATVVHGVSGDANPFCWSFTITPVTWSDSGTAAQGHIETLTFCPSSSTLYGGGSASQATRFQLSGIGPANAFTTLQCSPDEEFIWTADAGDVSTHLCNGDTPVGTTPVDFTSSGTYAFVGYEVMPLDNHAQVPAFHGHIDRKITPQTALDAGLAVSGLDQSDFHFATDNGMLLEWQRTVTVTTNIGIYGAVVFQESSDWRIVDRTVTPLPDGGVDLDAGADAAPKDAAPKDAPSG
jgi:hypothetical protein